MMNKALKAENIIAGADGGFRLANVPKSGAYWLLASHGMDVSGAQCTYVVVAG